MGYKKALGVTVEGPSTSYTRAASGRSWIRVLECIDASLRLFEKPLGEIFKIPLDFVTLIFLNGRRVLTIRM